MANDGLFPGLSLRHPPSNLQAEQGLLGALLHQNRAMERCLDLRPEHFFAPELGQVYARILERITTGRTVSAVSLKGEFGDPLLAELLGSMVGIPNVTEYATEIIECAGRRILIEIGEGLVTQAFAGAAPMELATEAANRMDALAVGSSESRGITLNAALDDAIQAIEDARQRQGPAGISTGFRCIDERIGGLEAGTLTVIAGRPGMGKSALGWLMALAAARDGVGVLAISLEMSSRELGRRALAAAARVPLAAMKYGRVTAEQAERIVLARREMNDLPLTIEDSAGLTTATIAARARAAKRKGLGMILVDHLHIVAPDAADAKQGATWAIGRISGAMKRLAKDCDVPVLLLAQLNRGVESRDDKRPGLSDLRQAGDIEQDADAVGFVYRPEYYLGNKPERKQTESSAVYDQRCIGWQEAKDQTASKAEVIWGKIRDGEPGSDHLMFSGPTTTFSEAPDV